MRRKQYSIITYIICITLILTLGFMGYSYAMWSDSHFIINKINTGSLSADIEIELPDNGCIVVTEKSIITSDDKQDNNNNDNDQGENNDDNENDDNNNQGNDDQGSGNQSCIKEYYCNYNEITFNIVNKGTVPLKLEKYEIILNSVNILHICSIVYDEFNYTNGELVITDWYNGHIQIDSNRLEELSGLINNENNNIILKFYFKQSNIINGGWTQEKTIFIPILKNSETIIINNDNENKDEDNENINQNEGNGKDNKEQGNKGNDNEKANYDKGNGDSNIIENNNSIESNTTENISGGAGNES